VTIIDLSLPIPPHVRWKLEVRHRDPGLTGRGGGCRLATTL
jgi:hypothetical protein